MRCLKLNYPRSGLALNQFLNCVQSWIAMQQLVATDREKLIQTRKSAAGKTAKAKLDALSRVQLPRRLIALKEIVSCIQLWAVRQHFCATD